MINVDSVEGERGMSCFGLNLLESGSLGWWGLDVMIWEKVRVLIGWGGELDVRNLTAIILCWMRVRTRTPAQLTLQNIVFGLRSAGQFDERRNVNGRNET